MSETPNDEGFESQTSPSCAEVLQLLLDEIEADPGAPVFPTLAEAYRRVGQAERAREIAAMGLEHAPERMAGRVALGLALLDIGEPDEAREALSAILKDVPELMALLEEEGLASPSDPAAAVDTLRDDEIDLAFDDAEAEPDEMVDVNDLAEAAIRQESLGDPRGGFTPSEHPVFATATMADLLENQGDSQGAERIRSSLTSEVPQIQVPQIQVPNEELAAMVSADEVGAARGASRADILATLEGWLENIRRDVA